jgi:hypothetical protein
MDVRGHAAHPVLRSEAPWTLKAESYLLFLKLNKVPEGLYDQLEKSWGDEGLGTFEGGLGAVMIVRYTDTPVGRFFCCVCRVSLFLCLVGTCVFPVILTLPLVTKVIMSWGAVEDGQCDVDLYTLLLNQQCMLEHAFLVYFTLLQLFVWKRNSPMSDSFGMTARCFIK